MRKRNSLMPAMVWMLMPAACGNDAGQNPPTPDVSGSVPGDVQASDHMGTLGWGNQIISISVTE